MRDHRRGMKPMELCVCGGTGPEHTQDESIKKATDSGGVLIGRPQVIMQTRIQSARTVDERIEHSNMRFFIPTVGTYLGIRISNPSPHHDSPAKSRAHTKAA